MSETMSSLLVSQTWQIAACAGAAWLMATTFGRRRPHLAHLVWMLVLVKAVTPPIVASHTSLFSWLQTERPVAISVPLPEPAVLPMDNVVAPIIIPGTIEPAAVARPSTVAGTSSMTVGWTEAGLILWAVGGLAMFLIIGVSTWRSWRCLSASQVPVDARLFTRFAELSRELGLRRTPRLLVTSQSLGPAAGGILSGTVIVPAELLDGSPTELEPLLAHELIHVRRRDPLFALLQWLAVSLWWWHPAVWWASRHVSRERERCCDAEVLGSLPYSPQQYAQQLIEVLRRSTASPTRPVPLTIPLTAPTHQRLESIMCSGPFPSRPPRRNLLVAAALGLLLIPGAALPTRLPGAPQATPDDQATTQDKGDITQPELVYLGWQINDTTVGSPMWRPNGEFVDEAETAEALKKSGQRSFLIFPRANDQLHPLVLVFKVGEHLNDSSVRPRVILPDGTITRLGGGINTNGKPLAVSTSFATLKEAPKWPDEVSLQIRYPVEDLQVVKTITEIPDEPVELADGVTWFLDPAWASERNPKTGKRHRPPGMTAAILQFRQDPLRLDDFDFRIYLKNRNHSDDSVGSRLSAGRKIDGDFYELDVSRPIAGKDAIERVEFTRIRHQLGTIPNVKLRPDVLARLVGKAATPDSEDIAAVQSFDRDYGQLWGSHALARVGPPFPTSRMAYYRIRHPRQAELLPDGPATMIFRSWGGAPQIAESLISGNPEQGSNLRTLLPLLCRIGPERLRGTEDLLNRNLPGDFVYNPAASREQLVASLNIILLQNESRPMSVKLQETEAEVYVATGELKLSDTAKQRDFVLVEGALTGTANSTEEALDSGELALRVRLDDFLSALATSIDVPIVNDVKPPPRVRLRYHSVRGKSESGGPEFDPEPVLEGVAAQTGLTFTKARRRIQTLWVKEAR